MPIKVISSVEKSAALSMTNAVKDTIKSRQIAFLAAFKHCKASAAVGEGVDFIAETFAGKAKDDKAVLLGDNAAQDFIKAIAQHRNWDREAARKVPA